MIDTKPLLVLEVLASGRDKPSINLTKPFSTDHHSGCVWH